MKPLLLFAAVVSLVSCGNRIDLETLRVHASEALATAQRHPELSEKDGDEIVWHPAGYGEGDMIVFEYAPGLRVRVSYPPGFLDDAEAAPLPAIVEVNTFPRSDLDESMGAPSWIDEIHQVSLLSFLSAAGYVSVFFEISSAYVDAERLLHFLLDHKRELRLNGRIGIYALSGHGVGGLTLIATEDTRLTSAITCAVFNHGDTRTPRPLRVEVPILMVMTDSEDYVFYASNRAFIRRAEAAGIDVTVDASAPYKNFEYDPENMEDTVRVFTGVLDFYRRYLGDGYDG